MRRFTPAQRTTAHTLIYFQFFYLHYIHVLPYLLEFPVVKIDVLYLPKIIVICTILKHIIDKHIGNVNLKE